MNYFAFVDSEQIRRERRKAQDLRQSNWWSQRLGQGICYYCGEKFGKDRLTMDHVLPLARGGKTTKKNCVVACKDCNTKKGHRMSVELTFDRLSISDDLALEDVE